MAVSLRTGESVYSDASAVTIATPADGPSLRHRAGRHVDVHAALARTTPGRCPARPRATRDSSGPPGPTPASPRRAGRSASGPGRPAAARPRRTARRRRPRSRPARSATPGGRLAASLLREEPLRAEQLGQVVRLHRHRLGRRLRRTARRPCGRAGRAAAPAAARRPRACSGG